MFLYIDPIKQGLKQPILEHYPGDNDPVFIHRSNKTRIETLQLASALLCNSCVFIHRSNKTRIETI